MSAAPLQCGGLYLGGGGETVPLPVTTPDRAVSLTAVAACSGTMLTLNGTGATDPGADIRTCTDAFGTCTAAAPGTCNSSTFSCPGTGICGGGTCTRGKIGLSCTANSDCDFDCVEDHDCDTCTAGNVGAHCNTTKGGNHQCSCLFGPPLPIPNSAVPNASICVLGSIGNDQDMTVSGSADCTTGATTLSIPLNFEVYLTFDLLPKRCSATTPGLAGFSCVSNASCPGGVCARDEAAIQPCPICNPTTLRCNGGPNEGAPCTPGTSALTGAYPTSHDCPPPHAGAEIGALPIPFSLTTGTASKTAFSTGAGNGKASIFCGFCKDPVSGFQSPPHACTADSQCTTVPFTSCEQNLNGAFAHADATMIEESGFKGGDLTGGAVQASTLVSVFCIPPAHDSTTDTNDGLPGPGAVSLPGKTQLLP